MTSAVTAQLILIQGDGQHFQRVIDLSNAHVSIGRAQTCDVVWGSLQISRQHATLEYVISKWYIRDTSTNGLSVNGNKLGKGELFMLKDQDIISFIPTGAVRYRFKYVSAGSTPLSRPNTSLGQNSLISPLPSTSNANAASSSRISSSLEHRSASSVEAISDHNHSDSEDSNHSESLLSLGNPEEYLYGFSGDELSQSPAVVDSEEDGPVGAVPKRKHHEDSSDNDNRPTDRKKKKMLYTSSEDESSKDAYLKSEYSKATSSNGSPFKAMSEDQVNKCDDLEILKAQLKSCLQKLGTTEVELGMLQMDRNIEREEFRRKEKDAESSNEAFKEEMFKKILELMESELSCSVCNEVFIQATVIECGHTFCSFCIHEWSRKKQECPICRKRFASRSRHIEVENFILKMFESFSGEIASKRKASIKEREDQVKKAAEDAARAATAHQSRGTGGNFHAFIQSTAERYVDFLAELHQINEILAPRPNSARGGAAGSDRRRSARIQERVVGDGAPPTGEPEVLRAPGRRRGGRTRAATRAAVLVPSVPAAPRIQLGRVDAANLDVNAPIPIVTLNDSVDDGLGAARAAMRAPPLRFPNHFINYVRRIPMNLMEVPFNAIRDGNRPNNQ
ncbi:E3 ubiquitin-protein ligase RNF8 [Orchesella cincta]|uniref:E3 ubiquitin-protein ligase CHFR n=1 Tax=Orchesella cincta TaxID=48709 RepID=A0A1D2NJZ4_ORCCI|nr:E3 ubiquitin-protein ligase RNF8 [Orchesella cincta]